ncbi:chalcone isomerase family protein [Desulforhopalus sp. 52FAK]
MRFLFIAVLLLVAGPSQAKEIAGVMVQEMVKTDTGIEMALNGAGIRSKFFFDIYIGELYLEKPSTDVKAILASEGNRRIVMHFLYKEVGKDKIVDGWNEGFAANSGTEEVEALQPRIDRFNEMFVDVKEGDRIQLDYVPEKGTVVTIAGKEKGVVEGKDFADALLLIWLGEKPVTKKLKKQLLSYSE